MNQRPLSRWATEAKAHLLKYRPKMAAQLKRDGKLDDWARRVAERATVQAALSIENGMFPLEAESEARKQHMFLPTEEDMPGLGQEPNTLPDPASLVTTPEVNRRKKPDKSHIGYPNAGSWTSLSHHFWFDGFR